MQTRPCPRAGGGVNDWVNRRVVHLLRSGIKPQKVATLVSQETRLCGRNTKQDIMHSIETWYAAKQKRIRMDNKEGRMGFINKVDSKRQEEILFTYSGIDMEYFRQLSTKVTPLGALSEMFGDKMMIIGRNQQLAELVRFSELTDVNLSTYQFIVPNPAEKEYGITKLGKVSQRCLDMVPTRWYLPIEFDGGLSLDDQCRIHFCLGKLRELRMLIYSGGKSIHGWYHVYKVEEEESRKFMQFAISLGADLMMWTRCQWTRIPGGINMKTGKQQELIYYKNVTY
jgi:hypothetical protein